MNARQLKWVYLIILSLIWGSSFILIKRGLVGLNPLQLGSLRILFAAIFLLLIGFRSLTKIPKEQWKYIALTATLGTFIPCYLFAIAQTEIDSSVSAILNSLTPLNTMVLGVLAFGLTFKKPQFLGILVGLTGTLVLIINGAASHPEQNYYYALLVLLSSVCYAVNVNLIKKHLTNLDPIAISTGNFLVLIIPAFIILFSSGFFDIIAVEQVQHSVIYVVILGFVGTGIANILFFKIIQISTPVFATSVTYLITVVASLWGLIDNEILTPIQFLAALIVLLGVYLSSRK